MKRVGELFEELGFRPDAPDSVKRAFIKHLVRAANESLAPPPVPRIVKNSESINNVGEQLCFALDEDHRNKAS